MNIHGMGKRLDHETLLPEALRYRRKLMGDDDDFGVECIDGLDIAVDCQTTDQAIGPSNSQSATTVAKSPPPPLVVKSYASNAITALSMTSYGETRTHPRL